jgi:hypothetical protein
MASPQRLDVIDRATPVTGLRFQLQEIEPQWRYDKMQAGRIASIIVDCTEAYAAQAEWLQIWQQ